MPQPLARDTSAAAEARQIAFFQGRTPCERLRATFEITAFALAAARDALQKAHPALSHLERARLFAALQFGPARAEQVRQPPSVEEIMSIPAALLPVARLFAQLGIPYYVGGSIASTAYSLPRATFDIDVAPAIVPTHVARLVAALEADYYIDRGAVLDAIAHAEAAFNITHQATGMNIDVFVTAGIDFDRSRYARAREYQLPNTSETVRLASPEDIVLNKLLWYWQDQIESQKQWRDIAGILRVQSQALDLAYLRAWASALDIGSLLEAALRGDPPPISHGGDDTLRQERLF